MSEATLPAGWRWERLGDVCTLGSGRFLSSDKVTQQGDIPVYGANGVIGYTHTPSVSEPCIVIGRVGSVGAINPVTEPAWITDNTVICRPGPDADFEFVWLHLQSCDLSALRGASVQPLITQSVLRPLLIPLPPLPEQRRIAVILREQLDAVRQAREAALARLEAVEAFSVVVLRSVFKSIEHLPKCPFGDIATLQRGHDLPSYMQLPGPYPIMTSAGQMGTHDEFKAQAPGVVTGRSGSIGKVFFVEENYWPHNTALYVKDFKQSYPRYIYYLLQWLNVDRLYSGVGVPTLDRKTVHRVLAPKADVQTQTSIAAKLDDVMAGYGPVQRATVDQSSSIDMLPQSLLREAFAGRV